MGANIEDRVLAVLDTYSRETHDLTTVGIAKAVLKLAGGLLAGYKLKFDVENDQIDISIYPGEWTEPFTKFRCRPSERAVVVCASCHSSAARKIPGCEFDCSLPAEI